MPESVPVPQPEIPCNWEHYPLWKRVRTAIFAAPDHFTTPTVIEGMLATDIFTLNAPLAATIEESVVNTLNALRHVWDPDAQYQTYSFVRQPQTFPDVLLRSVDNGATPILGIELKGWYLLAKENAPTYRFTVTEKACNPWDFLVVVPWVLSNVLAGSPVLLRPFVQPALYCARKRNHYWRHERAAKTDTTIRVPEGVRPYPRKSNKISDKPENDPGGNFGRLARYGIMDTHIRDTLAECIRGIPASDWIAFFREHQQ